MSASNKSLWQLFYSTHSSVITADLIDRELSHAPQSARRGVAWMHNAFFALVKAKCGSTDAFMAHLLNMAGANKRGFTFVSKQMEQCAEIAALLQPDCNAATESLPPDMLMMRLFDRMKDWWIIDNTESMYSRVLMHFMSSAGYVALDCTGDPIQKIESDKKLDRTIGLTFIAASQLHLMLRSNQLGEFSKLFANSSVESEPEPPALTEGAWNVFAVALSLSEIGFFVKFSTVLIGMLHDWKQENAWANREVQDCDAMTRLMDAIRVVDKFIPNGAAFDELAPCLKAADEAMQKLASEDEDSEKLQQLVRSLANAHARAIQSLDVEDCQTMRAALIDLGECSSALYRDKTKPELIKRGVDVCEGNDELFVLPAFEWIRELKEQLTVRS